MSEPLFPLLTLSRLRLLTDGEGVTTLIAGAGCPLRCKWCINRQLLQKAKPRQVSPAELYALVRQDDLYFQATGGGVTFGGGESLLHADFIAAFRALIGDTWRICAETSLHVPSVLLQKALPAVDEFIVDVKDADPEIYRAYTGGNAQLAWDNIRYLLIHGEGKSLKFRVPLISGFNTPVHCDRTEAALRSLGAGNIERFSYRIK